MRALGEMTVSVTRIPREEPAASPPEAPRALLPATAEATPPPTPESSPVVYGVRVWIEQTRRPGLWARWVQGVPSGRRAVVRSAGDDTVNVLCDVSLPVGERLALRPSGGGGGTKEEPFSCVVEECEPGGTGRVLWVAVLRIARARNHG